MLSVSLTNNLVCLWSFFCSPGAHDSFFVETECSSLELVLRCFVHLLSSAGLSSYWTSEQIGVLYRKAIAFRIQVGASLLLKHLIVCDIFPIDPPHPRPDGPQMR